jgi:hypothetical protein
MKKPDTLKIIEWSTKALITIVVDIILIRIGNFQGGLVIFIVGVVLFFVLLAVIHFSLDGLSKFLRWLRTPDRKLLTLERISFRNNDWALLFTNKEFRAPYIKIEKVYLIYEQRISLSVIPKELGQKVEQHPYHTNWQKLKIRRDELPLELPKSNKITIDFVKIDANNNQFYIDLEEVDKVVFDVATHIFQVTITYGIKKEMGKIKRYKVRVSYQGSDNLEIDIEHFD